MSDLYQELERCLKNELLVAMATVIVGPALGRKMLVFPSGEVLGTLGRDDLSQEVCERAWRLMHKQKTERSSFGVGEHTTEVFIEVFSPPPKLIIIGAVHVAIALISFAKSLGFRTLVVDPRSVFATPERFQEADELRVQWPDEALSPSDFHESTYFVVLSHDEKLDNPALKMALDNGCRYIGALGSRKTQTRREKGLKEMGITEEQIKLIHSPIGLDLGGRRAEEIALSIISEIVVVINRGDGKVSESSN